MNWIAQSERVTPAVSPRFLTKPLLKGSGLAQAVESGPLYFSPARRKPSMKRSIGAGEYGTTLRQSTMEKLG
jgi:hypothetical protein